MEPLSAAEHKARCRPQRPFGRHPSALRLLPLLLSLLCMPHRSMVGASRMHASSRKLLQEKWEDFHKPHHTSVIKASAVHLHRTIGTKLASRARQPSKQLRRQQQQLRRRHLDSSDGGEQGSEVLLGPPPPVAEVLLGVHAASLHEDKIQSKPTAELAFSAFAPGEGACFADAYEARIGCKAGCTCQWYEECYSKEVLFKEDGTGGLLTPVDIGTCGLSLRVLGAIAMMLFWLGVLVIVFFRVRFEKQEAASQQESLVARKMLGRPPPKGVAVSVRTATTTTLAESSGGATSSGTQAGEQETSPGTKCEQDTPMVPQEQLGQQEVAAAERSEPAPSV